MNFFFSQKKYPLAPKNALNHLPNTTNVYIDNILNEVRAEKDI